MSKYYGKIIGCLCLLSHFFATTYGMETSFEELSLTSLGTLYLSLKEDVTGLQHGQKKHKKFLKEMREEQRYTLLILAELQRDQRNAEKKIKKLERNIARCVYEVPLQLKMLDWAMQHEVERIDAQIRGLIVEVHDSVKQEAGSARSSVLFDPSLNDFETNRDGRFVAASPSNDGSCDGSYKELP